MGEHAQLVLLWGANLASQPNTGRHVAAARRRGARIVTLDVRETEAARQSDEASSSSPARTPRWRSALMHVIVAEHLHDRAFIAQHTVGFDALAAHVNAHTPEWAAAITGVSAERIVALARRYATTRPAMIVAGGSSMHKGTAAGRRVAPSRACRRSPATSASPAAASARATGAAARSGASRHHGARAPARRARTCRTRCRASPTRWSTGRVRVLLLSGTDMTSSFADAGRVGDGLARLDLVVSYDLFMNDTARRFARHRAAGDRVARGARLQEHEHARVPDAESAGAAGRGRPPMWMLRELARRTGSTTSSRGRTTPARSTRSSITRGRGTRRWPSCSPRAGCASSTSRTSAIPT